MLAATRLIALHKNKGMTVAACLKNRTDYIENPDKTEQGQYVSSYACSALTADEEFLLLYHVPSPKTIAFLTKDTHKNFPP